MAHCFIGALVQVGEDEGNTLAEEDHVHLSMSRSLYNHVVVPGLHGTFHRGGNEEARDSIEIERSIALHAVHVDVLLLHNGCVDHEGTRTLKKSRICSLP